MKKKKKKTSKYIKPRKWAKYKEENFVVMWRPV